MIVLFGGEKGGAGKSTLATNIAAIRTFDQPHTLLIDTDRQSTASFWCSIRNDHTINPRINSIQQYGTEVRDKIISLNHEFQDIIIDAGGRDSPELRASLLISNIAIFPLRPSQFDLWTIGRIGILVEKAKEINESLEAYIVVNLASTHPWVQEISNMRALTQDFKMLKIFNTNIYDRIVYRKAALNGLSVIEYKPQDPKATNEITNLYKEIF
ncbi:AAA family ATPase [Rickettsia conorii]|uniref:Chromosome partitioning protein n=1 Tax=Rickettsia conorii subsp. raoultii TaxID=369822 RepID=A0A9N7BQY0_RICCR|nr:AAA family ATPase [Rickettsia conorii]AJQ52544.1 chromosome partitioning protein [Rickettsia conorii subsp. raoultii]